VQRVPVKFGKGTSFDDLADADINYAEDALAGWKESQ
jgi:hypothetical protein